MGVNGINKKKNDVMRASIGLLVSVILLSACAPVLNTGTTKKNTYRDARHGFIFTKADNWRYSIPWEKKTESAVRRFSIYVPQTQYSSGRMFVGSLAKANFVVDTTQMNLKQVNDELLKKYQDFKFAGRFLLGELGDGYHLTQERNGLGDAYFTVKDGKLYLIDFVSLKGQYMKFRLQLEKMLTTITFAE